MGCVGCNDGCFDESVQLAQGPAGPAGADGHDGADGSTTISPSGTDISVTGTGTSGDPYIVNFTGTNGDHNVLETGVAQVDVTGTFSDSPNPVISKVINGTTENINGIGDIIRLEFFIIGDVVATDTSSEYYYKVSFGGNTVIDTSSTIYELSKYIGDSRGNAVNVIIDIIVSASDSVTPVLKHKRMLGDRSAKQAFNDIPSIQHQDFVHVLPTITGLTLSGNNTLSVALESSDGTSNISLMSYKIMKFLKA